MRPALGVSGQFGVGLLLGAVWSPCVGPTLGAASLLAARGEDLGSVAVTMLLFGIGAAVPLAALGLMSRRTLLAWRGRIASLGGGLKVALGVVSGRHGRRDPDRGRPRGGDVAGLGVAGLADGADDERVAGRG